MSPRACFSEGTRLVRLRQRGAARMQILPLSTSPYVDGPREVFLWSALTQPESAFHTSCSPQHKSSLGSCPWVIDWIPSCLPGGSWYVAILRT